MKWTSTLVLVFSFFLAFGQQKPRLNENSIRIDSKDLKISSQRSFPKKSVESIDYHNQRTFNVEAFNEHRFEVKSWNEGRPTFIKGALADARSFATLEGQANQYLSELSSILSIDEPINEFIQVSSTMDELNMTHIRFNQVYQGIKILGAEFILHEHKGKIGMANGKTFPTPKIDLTLPCLSENQIKEIVHNDIPEKPLTKSQQRFMPKRWHAEKVIHFPNPQSEDASLAYHIEYRPNIFDRWFLTVDAYDGTIINKHSGVCKFHNHDLEGSHKDVSDSKTNSTVLVDGPATANAIDLLGVNRSINTYEFSNQFFMIDASRPMFDMAPSGIFESEGVIVTLDAQNLSPQNSNFEYTDVRSNNNSWNDRTSVSAHYNGGEAYEYFKDTHNRNSINGAGGTVISLIHVSDENGNAMDNAFWNGAAMWYGDGNQAFFPLARGLDVAGHEISHGVVQSTANLAYQGESGALNESFADVFGAMIDRDDWQMGEDVVKQGSFPSGALRDLEDPHNGAAPGNYGGGFQPKHTNEMYTGNEDNGGVHINSGIPNHAYYLFATAVGKNKAEKVWYRALQNYLTASSQFIDLRIFTIQAASELYGTTEVNALKSAMDQVGILDGEGGDYQEDVDVNSGSDFLILTDINNEDIFLASFSTGDVVKISDTDPISKPSVSDDGSKVVFISTEKKMHEIVLDWSGGGDPVVSEMIIQSEPIWRNVVTSRDGTRLAGLFDDSDNRIWVYDYNIQSSNEYELYNPTTSSDGSTTGDVRYADALEFDFSGNWIMYDALNRINGTGGSTIEYWDIGFLKIWNEDIDTWSLGEVSKLFSSLPADVNIGYPTFSKNSPYIIAFDYVDENGYAVLGYNLETNEDGLIRENGEWGFPSFSRLDDAIVYDDYDNQILQGVGQSVMQSDKISASQHANITDAYRWPRWFANGERPTSLEELEKVIDEIKVYPNPTSSEITIDLNKKESGYIHLQLVDLLGKTVYADIEYVNKGSNSLGITIPKNISSGHYILKLSAEGNVGATMIQLIK